MSTGDFGSLDTVIVGSPALITVKRATYCTYRTLNSDHGSFTFVIHWNLIRRRGDLFMGVNNKQLMTKTVGI